MRERVFLEEGDFRVEKVGAVRPFEPTLAFKITRKGEYVYYGVHEDTYPPGNREVRVRISQFGHKNTGGIGVSDNRESFTESDSSEIRQIIYKYFLEFDLPLITRRADIEVTGIDFDPDWIISE